jgi:hypothetical protein
MDDEARSRRLVVALAGVQVADAAFNLVPSRWIEADLEHLQLPQDLRFLFGTVKAASAAGLVVGLRFPTLGRFTARALIGYFVLALVAHVRIKDKPVRYAPALAMLGFSAMALRCFPKADRHTPGARGCHPLAAGLRVPRD